MNRVQQLLIRVAIVILAILLMTACVSDIPAPEVKSETQTAIGNIQETTIMTPQIDQKVIPLNRALVLKFQERMGTETQSIQADVTNQLLQGLGNGVQISSGQILEDYQDTEQIVLLFVAAPINNLDGSFALTLYPQSGSASGEPGTLAIRETWIEPRGNQFVVLAEVQSDSSIGERWTYTRHPDTRQVYLAMYDDPNEVFEGEVFHQVPLSPWSTTSVPVSGADWSTIEFNLPPGYLDQSVTIDQCEILIEKLDPEISANTGEFLQWQRDLVTPETIDRVASDLEASKLLPEGEFFNVTLKMLGEEITRNKRIRPFVEHPITIFEKYGSPRAADLGCSISS